MSKLLKPDLSRCRNLLQAGFSLITVKEDKIPNIRWKEYQSTPMGVDTFENFYNLPNSFGVGLVCGYDDLEVIDVDLKVLPSLKEREDFWNEYYGLLRDNIPDFEKRFVIVRTRNYGYHILYKSAKKTGNVKIAKLKDHQEAIIESRGIGGYVWIYDQFIQGNNYSDIQVIDEQDRTMLWEISKMYDYIEPVQKIEPTIVREYHEAEVKTWDDYNAKTSIFDLIGSEFEITRKLTDKYVVKRKGATSPHSGYVYNN